MYQYINNILFTMDCFIFHLVQYLHPLYKILYSILSPLVLHYHPPIFTKEPF